MTLLSNISLDIVPGRGRASAFGGLMKHKRGVLVTCATLLLSALPLLGHHSLEAQYDPTHSMTLSGTLTKVDWSNPHVHFFIDVKDASSVVNWEVEMGSPNAQILSGWKIDSFKPGDHIMVTAYRARDGSHVAHAKKIMKAGR